MNPARFAGNTAARAKKGLWEAAKFTGSYTEEVDFSCELEVEDLYNLAAISPLAKTSKRDYRGFVEQLRQAVAHLPGGLP